MANQTDIATIKAKAAKYAAKGEYEKAIEEYRKILASEPNNAETINLIGDAYRRMGEDAKAVTEFETAIELFMQDAYYDNAIAVCKKVLRINPSRSSVYTRLAELYIEQGLVGQAASIMMDYIKRKKDEGNYKEVLDAYNKLIDIRPKDVGIRMKLVDEYITMEKTDAAINQLKEVSSLYEEQGRNEEVEEINNLINEISGSEVVPIPREEVTEVVPKEEVRPIEAKVEEAEPSVTEALGTESYMDKANLYKASGSTVDAVDNFYKAAESFLEEKSYKDAKKAFLEITKLRPDEIRPYQKLVEVYNKLNDKDGILSASLGLGDALRNKGAMKPAESIYKKVLSMDPNNNEAKLRLSSLSSAAPHPAESKTKGEGLIDYGKVVRDELEDKPQFKVVEEPTKQEGLITLEDLMEEFKAGIKKQIPEDDYATHYDLGISFKEMGRIDEAISEFQKSLKGEKEKLKSYEMLGVCFSEKDELDLAIKQLQNGLSIKGHSEGEYFGIRYHLGLAYEKKGSTEDAIAEYEEIYTRDISFLDVAERLKNLKLGKVEIPTLIKHARAEPKKVEVPKAEEKIEVPKVEEVPTVKPAPARAAKKIARKRKRDKISYV